MPYRICIAIYVEGHLHLVSIYNVRISKVLYVILSLAVSCLAGARLWIYKAYIISNTSAWSLLSMVILYKLEMEPFEDTYLRACFMLTVVFCPPVPDWGDVIFNSTDNEFNSVVSITFLVTAPFLFTVKVSKRNCNHYVNTLTF